jgi:hypothetical protein
MKTKWDIVDDLGTDLKGMKATGGGYRRVALRNALSTSLCAVSLLVMVPSVSLAQCDLSNLSASAAAFTPVPAPVIRIRQTRQSRHKNKDQRVDTTFGLTSRQLANKLAVFFKPADPEPEDTSDYSFF